MRFENLQCAVFAVLFGAFVWCASTCTLRAVFCCTFVLKTGNVQCFAMSFGSLVWCAHVLFMRFESLQRADFYCVDWCPCLVCKYMRFESCVLLHISFEDWPCAVFASLVWRVRALYMRFESLQCAVFYCVGWWSCMHFESDILPYFEF